MALRHLLTPEADVAGAAGNPDTVRRAWELLDADGPWSWKDQVTGRGRAIPWLMWLVVALAVVGLLALVLL